MLAVAKNAVGLMIFGGIRLAHGVGDGFAFVLLGMVGVGMATWGIARALRRDSAKS